MTDVNWLGNLGERTNEVLGQLGLEKSAAMLSEGFCPVCQKKSSSIPVFLDDDDHDRDDRDDLNVSAIVNCQQCQTRWRTGLNHDNGKDWIEHSRGGDGIRLTMLLNGPTEKPCMDDNWWDDDDV